MDVRERILREAKRLTIENGVVPSLNSVADAAGVSKGGLIHHFPTRRALVDGLALAALADADKAMADAAAGGRVVDTWLALSLPDGEDVALFRSMAVAHRALGELGSTAVEEANRASLRWERYVADEVGDATLARVIRLVGDGLMMNAVTALDTPTAEEIQTLASTMRSWARS